MNLYFVCCLAVGIVLVEGQDFPPSPTSRPADPPTTTPAPGSVTESPEDSSNERGKQEKGKGGCPDDLPDGLEEIREEIEQGTKTSIDVLPYASELSSRCFHRIAESSFDEDDCSIEQVKEVACQIEEVQKMKDVLRCLQKDLWCQLALDLLSTSQCLDDDVMDYYRELIRKEKCSTAGLPADAILQLGKNSLKDRLESLSLSEVLDLLASASTAVIQSTRCDNLETLAHALKKKLKDEDLAIDSLFNGDIVDPSDVLHILPYFNEKSCADLSKPVLDTIGIPTLGTLPFMCGKADDRRSDMEDELEEIKDSMAEGDDDDDDDDDDEDSDSEEDEESEREAQEEMISEIKRKMKEPRCESKCGKAIAKTLASQDDGISLDDPTVLESFGNLKKCLPRDTILDAAKPGKCGQLGADLVPSGSKDRKNLAKRCLPERGDLGGLNATDLENMGCAILGLSKKDLDDIPISALRGALGTIRDCLEEADSDFMKHLEKRIRKGILTGEDIKGLGRAAARSSRQRLQDLLASDLDDDEVLQAIVDGIEDMAKKREPGSKAKAFDIVNRLDDFRGISESEEMMGSISKKTLEKLLKKLGQGKLDVNTTRRLLGLDQVAADPKPTFSQTRLLVRALLGGKLPEDLTEEDIDQLKGTIINGLSAEDIKKLIKKEKKLRFLHKLCQKGKWNEQQTDAIYELMKNAFEDFDPDAPFSEFTSAHAQAFSSACLLGISDKDLRKMTNSACDAVCAKKAGAKKLMCLVDRQDLEVMVQTCLECRGNANVSDMLSEDDVKALGKSLLAAPPEVLERIPDELLIKRAKLFTPKCTTRRLRDIIRQKVQDAFSGNLTDDEKAEIIDQAGFYVLSKLPADVRERVKELLADKLDSILEDLGTPDDDEEAEEDQCCRDMNTEEENEEVDEEEEELEGQVAEVVDSTASGGARRRRRAGNAYTCADLRSLGSAITKLTVTDIEQITSDEFYNCLSAIGSGSGWSAAQAAALLAKLKSLVASNDICDVPSSHLQDMKYIAYHFTVENIKCLNHLNEDAVTVLGTLHEWTEEQAFAFARKYMMSKNIATPGGFSDSHLVTLGHFLCGFAADDIRRIQPDEYSSAVSTLGRLLKTCTQNKLQALAYLAIQSSGPVSSWDASVYSENGIVIAGLSGEELRTATPGSIEGWQPKGIKLIPLSELGELDPAHFDAFSRQQALAIPEETRNQLSACQQKALNRALRGVDRDPEQVECSGAAKLKAVWMVPLALSTLTVLAGYRLLWQY